MASVASLIHVMAALPGIADKLDKLECMVLQLQGRVDDVFREVYKTTEDKDSEEEDGTEDLMDTDGEQSGEDGSYDSSFIDDAEQEGEAGDSEEDYDPDPEEQEEDDDTSYWSGTSTGSEASSEASGQHAVD
mmetsp:Transcript_18102/g.56747  ORF Transcript_18102/g.56747 Transcript_18102/m.56747 type:complete len:132 (-) Transcript_18102:782-1177(-)